MANINYLDNKKFKTLIIKFLYPFEISKENLACMCMLPRLLINTSEKFRKEDEFQKEFLRNYILNFSYNRIELVKQCFYCFNLVVPAPKEIDEDFLENTVKFFIETIYKPNVKNGEFDLDQFTREKECLKIGINNSKRNINGYSIQRVYELIDDTGYLKMDLYNYAEQLDTLTPSDVYKFYEKTIKPYLPIVFVSGNCDKNKLEKILKKYLFDSKRIQKEFSTSYNYFLPLRNEVQKIEEEGPFHQSALYLIYKIKEMKEEDRVLLFVISSLLSSQSSSLLHKNLRDDGKLVYSTYSTTLSHNAVLITKALIHKNAKEEAIDRIKQTIEMLKNKEIIEPLLENIKERKRISLESIKDNHYGLVNEQIAKFLKIDQTLEEEYQLIKTLTPSDISDFASRMYLDTIYFLGGNKNEK